MSHTLPPYIANYIDSLLSHEKTSHQDFIKLSSRYRNAPSKKGFTNSTDYTSYLTTRMPATYQAVGTVLQELTKLENLGHFQSVLDIGSGPGTALFAFQDYLPTVSEITFLEEDIKMINIAKDIQSNHPSPAKISNFEQSIFEKFSSPQSYDLVMMSYSLNEWPPDKQESIFLKAWSLCQKTMIILMPGTPSHFKSLSKIRELAIKNKGFIIAPCTHNLSCPLANTSNWCHFSTHVNRSTKHRQAKGSTLGYEEEKFSYLIVERTSSQSNEHIGRVVFPPLRKKGHTIIDTCISGEIQRKTYSKKSSQAYSQIKKVKWGDKLLIND